MPLWTLNKITGGVSHAWGGYLRDWDRHLRSATTRYSDLLSAAQLARYQGEYSPDPDAADAPSDRR